MKCSKEIQNHVSNIQWYTDKILESIGKEVKTADNFDSIVNIEEIGKVIKELCNNIVECAKE